jgi:hypothetical protein
LVILPDHPVMRQVPIPMKWSAPLSHAVLFALCVVALVGWKIDSIGSLSVDLAHHYALVERLADKWWLPPISDPVAAELDWRSLGEMSYYPAASHRIAAVLGRILQSSFIGMQATALVALAVIWATIAFILFRLPRPAAVASSIALAVGLIVGAHVLRLPIHGDEITASFFFAQLVGQCVAVLCLGGWIALERDGDDQRRRYLLMLGAPAFTVSFHLLPALELLGFFGCVIAFDFLTDPPAERRRNLLRRALILLAATALVAVHPAFRAMLMIADNNGALPIVYFSGNGSLGALAVVVVALAGANLAAWRRWGDAAERDAYAAVKYPALFAAAVGLLCLAQIIALRIGVGNDYAVRKYIFALITFSLIEAAILVGLLLFQRLQRRRAMTGAGPFDVVWPLALLTLGFTLGGPSGHAPITTARIATLERQVKGLKDARLPWTEARYDVVARLAGMPPVVDYMLSLGILRTWREANAAAILAGGDLQELDQIGTIITSRLAERYDVPACRLFTARSGLTLIDAGCLNKIDPRRRACEGDYDFAAKASSGVYEHLLSGFSVSEAAGRWTDGPRATFRCDQPGGGRAASRVRLEMTPFLAPSRGLTSQRLIVKINGEVAASHVLSSPESAKTFDLPPASNADGALSDRIEIILELPDAAAPKDLAINDDIRRLGVQVRRIIFE